MVMQDNNTRLFTIFLSQGYGGAGQAPESLVTNNELLGKLRADCLGIEFIPRDTTSSNASVQRILSELESLKPTLDGVLVVGTSREYGLALTGLPTIVVYNLFEWMMIPYKLFNTGREENSVLAGRHEYGEGRVLTAQIEGDCHTGLRLTLKALSEQHRIPDLPPDCTWNGRSVNR